MSQAVEGGEGKTKDSISRLSKELTYQRIYKDEHYYWSFVEGRKFLEVQIENIIVVFEKSRIKWINTTLYVHILP